MKEYKAIISIGDQLSHRVRCVLAETAEEAKRKLEAQYGEGHVHYVQHDEDEQRYVAQGAIGREDGALKAFRAIIWIRNDQLGHRVCVLAETAEEAKRKLEAQYGEGHVYTLRNEGDRKEIR